jgi:hypothetical protein
MHLYCHLSFLVAQRIERDGEDAAKLKWEIREAKRNAARIAQYELDLAKKERHFPKGIRRVHSTPTFRRRWKEETLRQATARKRH